jgi:hypothetical protein
LTNESDQDLEHAKKLFLDLYAAARRQSVPDQELKRPFVVEAGKHESDI